MLTGSLVLFAMSLTGADEILVDAETVLTGNSVMSFPGADIILDGVVKAKDVLCSGLACL